MRDEALSSQNPELNSTPARQRRDVYLRLPLSTMIRIPIWLVTCYLIYLLLPFFMLLFLSTLLAVTFAPLVAKIETKTGHKAVVAIIGLSLAIVIGTILTLVLPQLLEQISGLYGQVPQFVESLRTKYPPIAAFLKQLPAKMESVEASSLSPLVAHIAAFGGVAVGGLSSIVLIFAFMMYLLLDGARVFEWLVAFFKLENRKKIEQTCEGVAPVVSAYVIGQLVTSTLCAIVSYIVLSVLNVPGALVLAVLAGIFDILPIVGFFLFTLPAALFALTVSTETMLWVLLAFGAYHLIETYLVSPYVYGNRLRVSGIVVLSSLIAGGTLGGILGAIAILPVVASYPVVEEIWLGKHIGRRVVNRHKKIASDPTGSGEAAE